MTSRCSDCSFGIESWREEDDDDDEEGKSMHVRAREREEERERFGKSRMEGNVRRRWRMNADDDDARDEERTRA